MAAKKQPAKASSKATTKTKTATQRRRSPNYSDEEKRVALELVIVCAGNVAEAARKSGIDYKTLSDWERGENVKEDIYRDYRTAMRARVAERVEALHATKDEVLSLYAMQLRADLGNLADFFESDGQFDLKRAKASNLSRLLKKCRTNRRPVRDSLGKIVDYDVTTEIEICDPKAAADSLSKVFGLFQSNKENEEDVKRRAELAEQAKATLAEYRKHVKTDAEALTLLQQDAPELASALLQ